jgi:hypothetical protein
VCVRVVSVCVVLCHSQKKLKNVAPFFKQKVEPMGPSEVLIGVGFAYAYS